MKRFLLAIAAAAVAFSLCAPALAADVQIVTPAYTLTCASHMQGKRVVLNCVPSHTSTTQASHAFDGWHYGQALPRAMFVQYVGNGAPALCDGISINCSTGVVALNLANANTWTATQTFSNIIDSGLGTTAGTPVCITVASQLTTAGCTGSGGGDTITTPNSTLTVGGTSTATTLDLNLAHINAWTAILSNTAQIQALGAGGGNACTGTNYPATAYGFCAGANNGATNIVGLVIGPQRTDFACTATCTAGDSAHIAFFDSNTSGAGGRECDLWKVQASASMESSCGLIAAGAVQTTILRNQVTNDWNGTCASVATGPHCVTGTHSGVTESALTCFQLDITNHSLAVDTGVTLSNGAAYTFTSTIPNGFVGSTSTAPTTGDTVTWWCFKP